MDGLLKFAVGFAEPSRSRTPEISQEQGPWKPIQITSLVPPGTPEPRPRTEQPIRHQTPRSKPSTQSDSTSRFKTNATAQAATSGLLATDTSSMTYIWRLILPGA